MMNMKLLAVVTPPYIYHYPQPQVEIDIAVQHITTNNQPTTAL